MKWIFGVYVFFKKNAYNVFDLLSALHHFFKLVLAFKILGQTRNGFVDKFENLKGSKIKKKKAFFF